MKAIVIREFGAPEVMKFEEDEKPQPSSTQVLVAVKAIGVNPVDTYIRSGNHPHAPALPFTPGKDAAGLVESVGSDVKGWKVGDRVYTADSLTGTYAEFALCDESQLGALPDNVTFEQGAGIWTPYATSYRALFQKADAKKGETVLIHGASGGVGVAAIQWAKNAGLTVMGTASSDEGKTLVGEQGADHVFDHTNSGHFEQVANITDGKGVDVIIEMLANMNLERDFESLAMFGRIVVVGSRGSLEFSPRFTMAKEATIFGMSLYNSPQPARDEIHSAIFKGMNDGFLSPVVGQKLPLADAPLSHHQVIENKAFGKIVLVP